MRLGSALLGDRRRFAFGFRREAKSCGLLVGLFGVVFIGFSQTASAQDRPTVHVSTVARTVLLGSLSTPSAGGSTAQRWTGGLR